MSSSLRGNGEGGGLPNSDQRKGGCMNLVLARGGRGSESRIIRRRHKYMPPYVKADSFSWIRDFVKSCLRPQCLLEVFH